MAIREQRWPYHRCDSIDLYVVAASAASILAFVLGSLRAAEGFESLDDLGGPGSDLVVAEGGVGGLDSGAAFSRGCSGDASNVRGELPEAMW